MRRLIRFAGAVCKRLLSIRQKHPHVIQYLFQLEVRLVLYLHQRLPTKPKPKLKRTQFEQHKRHHVKDMHADYTCMIQNWLCSLVFWRLLNTIWGINEEKPCL